MSKKIYDYNQCFLIAKQCTCVSDMQRRYGGAYNVARKNNWISDYDWFVRKQHAPYTYDEVYKIAKKYFCSSDFQKGNGSAYGKARANGWINDYTWFRIKQHAPYTREECYEIAKKYTTRVAYARGDVGAYNASLNHGWLDDYTWFESRQKPFNYWTKERVLEESKKYKTRGEFHDKNGSAYGKARTKGWLDECIWLKDERIDFSNDKIDCVYAYEFTDFNAVYIGRTLERRAKDRDKEHLFVASDTVSLFARKHDVPLPDMKILEAGLTLAQGVEKEKLYLERYKNDGWYILNRAKAGSIGLLARNKWTKKTCYIEALRHASRADFAKNSGGAYEIARQNGWLEDYTWFKKIRRPNGYWRDYDNCYNAALECKTISEFSKAYNPAYVWAKKQGWLNDYSWFPPSVTGKKWYYENCLEEAKRYTSLADFMNNSSGAYNASRNNGWLDDFKWLARQHKPKGYWDYGNCYKEAQKYKSSSEFQKQNQTAWIMARKKGWLKDYSWFVDPRIKWTYAECKKVATQASGRFDFRKRFPNAYNAAIRNKWLDDFFPSI